MAETRLIIGAVRRPVWVFLSLSRLVTVAGFLGAVATPAIAQPALVPTDLGTLGGGYSRAWAINDAGQVVGQSRPASGSYDHAFLWTAASGMVDLGTLGGTSSSAYAINNAGQVVGVSSTINGRDHAFVWTAASGMVDLGTLGGLHSGAFGINNAGQVVGESRVSGSLIHAFVWTAASGMVDLGSGNPSNFFINSTARGINDAGQVVGSSWPPLDPFSTRAVLWTPASGMVVDLGTLGRPYSYANGINDAGDVVGSSVVSPKSCYIRPALHPGAPRCSSVEYSRYSPSSRLARRAHRRPRC